jgi:hypothetical protein
MPFTRNQKRELGITDLNQYAMVGTSNVSFDEVSFEAKIIPKIVEQLRGLMEEVIDSRCVNSKLDKNRESSEA